MADMPDRPMRVDDPTCVCQYDHKVVGDYCSCPCEADVDHDVQCGRCRERRGAHQWKHPHVIDGVCPAFSLVDCGQEDTLLSQNLLVEVMSVEDTEPSEDEV